MSENTQKQSVLPTKGNTDIMEIHSSVVSSIAKKSALSVSGVVRLADGSIVDNLTEMVGTGKSNLDRSILVETHEGVTSVGIRIVADMNCQAAEVAHAVQHAVAESVEAMTGLKIKEVNVMVMDFEDPDKFSSDLL